MLIQRLVMKNLMRTMFLTSLILTLALSYADDETPIAIADLPKPVSTVVATAVPGATIRAATKNTELTYRVECSTATEEVTLTLTPSGKVLERETTISVEDLPDVVRSAVAKAVPHGKISEVIRNENAGVITYKIGLDQKKGKKVIDEIDLVVSPSGNILEQSSSVTEAALPEVIKTAIAQIAPRAHVEDATRCDRNGSVTYEVKVTTIESDIELEFDAVGSLLDRNETKKHGKD